MSTRTKKATAPSKAETGRTRKRATAPSAARTRLHDLVDHLPETELQSAERMLGFLIQSADPFLWKLLNAPPDDEPLTDADKAALEEAREDIRAGRAYSLEEAERLLQEGR